MAVPGSGKCLFWGGTASMTQGAGRWLLPTAVAHRDPVLAPWAGEEGWREGAGEEALCNSWLASE